MSQLEKNIDLPDTLLALNEFKQNNLPRNPHVVKKSTSTSLKPDLPDILEPIQEIITNNLPKPLTIKEESKNPETDFINNIKNDTINNNNNIIIEEKKEEKEDKEKRNNKKTRKSETKCEYKT